MKKRNSVFNKYTSGNQYHSDQKNNYSSKNGLLGTQTEFAREFFHTEPAEDEDYQKREHKSKHSRESSSNK